MTRQRLQLTTGYRPPPTGQISLGPMFSRGRLLADMMVMICLLSVVSRCGFIIGVICLCPWPRDDFRKKHKRHVYFQQKAITPSLRRPSISKQYSRLGWGLVSSGRVVATGTARRVRAAAAPLAATLPALAAAAHQWRETGR